MMKIRYENTIEDSLAFNLYHCTISPLLRKTARNERWGFSAATLVIVAGLGNNNPRTFVPMAMFDAALFFAIYPLLWKWIIRRRVSKLYAEAANVGFLCEHEVEATPEALIERSPNGETKSFWASIERVETTEGYTFIYTGPMMAHIIPRNRVPVADYEAFMSVVRKHFVPKLPLTPEIMKPPETSPDKETITP